MAAASSKKVVYAALVGNLLIAVTKLIAAAWSGSSAMLSEGVHSLVDTGNEVLLLYGMHRAKRPPDADHPLGYGRELYFWSFIVAVLIFAVGAGVSFYEGISHILNPIPIADAYVNYAGSRLGLHVRIRVVVCRPEGIARVLRMLMPRLDYHQDQVGSPEDVEPDASPADVKQFLEVVRARDARTDTCVDRKCVSFSEWHILTRGSARPPPAVRNQPVEKGRRLVLGLPYISAQKNMR